MDFVFIANEFGPHFNFKHLLKLSQSDVRLYLNIVGIIIDFEEKQSPT